MRKFRFIGDPLGHPEIENYYTLEKGKIYKGNMVLEEHRDGRLYTAEVCADKAYFPEDWVEILPKPLHKDTDLGYYAGLAMRGIVLHYAGSPIYPERIAADSIDIAKELIKQLNEETK